MRSVEAMYEFGCNIDSFIKKEMLAIAPDSRSLLFSG